MVEIIRGKSSKDKKAMHFLRCRHLFTAKYDLKLSVVHVPGVSNNRAYALSRNNMDLFSR